MATAHHFTELECWQLATDLKNRLYRLAMRPAVRDDRRFYDQLRHAAASAPRNIAEGFGRHGRVDFARFLDIARGSLNECGTHVLDAIDRGYITEQESRELLVLNKRAFGAVAGPQRYLRSRET